MLHFYLDATTETGNLGTQSQDLHPQEESNTGAQIHKKLLILKGFLKAFEKRKGFDQVHFYSIVKF
jgi:hypothetical protein